MNNILQFEQPDLVVLTGDIITGKVLQSFCWIVHSYVLGQLLFLEGNNIKNNATAYYKMAITPMLKFGVPWAMTFGNHDALASGSGGTRQDLMKVSSLWGVRVSPSPLQLKIFPNLSLLSSPLLPRVSYVPSKI